MHDTSEWDVLSTFPPFTYSQLVSTCVSGKGVCTVTSGKDMVNECLGVSPNEGGTHSLRPGVKVYQVIL